MATPSDLRSALAGMQRVKEFKPWSNVPLVDIVDCLGDGRIVTAAAAGSDRGGRS